MPRARGAPIGDYETNFGVCGSEPFEKLVEARVGFEMPMEVVGVARV